MESGSNATERDNVVLQEYVVYHWLCPSCGNINVAQPWPIELSDEERQDIIDKYGPKVVAQQWFGMPDEVTCEHCMNAFDANKDEEVY